MKEEKNKVGRPSLFKSTEELQKKIDEYFDIECRDEYLKDKETGQVLLDTKGNHIINYNPPTISGLALYLGFCSRQSLTDYAERKEFSYTIKKAITRIEKYAEKQLFIGSATGAIFWLKNKGWKDKTETELSGNLGVKKVFITKQEIKKADELIDKELE